ncbi:MAG: hypothetical protein U1D35_02795 [Paracoccaceae bacterium]|nr:hypothetical protein [Paracoccaceae bacterium]
MKSLFPALAVLMFFGAPAFATGFSIDLPRLTWPDETAAPVTRGCADHTSPIVAPPCEPGK